MLSANSAKTLLLIAIILCLEGQGLATEVNSSYIYWGHISDPPEFKLRTLGGMLSLLFPLMILSGLEEYGCSLMAHYNKTNTGYRC